MARRRTRRSGSGWSMQDCQQALLQRPADHRRRRSRSPNEQAEVGVVALERAVEVPDHAVPPITFCAVAGPYCELLRIGLAHQRGDAWRARTFTEDLVANGDEVFQWQSIVVVEQCVKAAGIGWPERLFVISTIHTPSCQPGVSMDNLANHNASSSRMAKVTTSAR